MASTSIYQQFLRAVRSRISRDYPYVKRFAETISESIPKSSSFLFGRSPIYDKYVVLHFQHNARPWGAGQVTVNVAIFRSLSKLGTLQHFRDYAAAEEGTYRLGAECRGHDIWWCLKDRDRAFDEQMKGILRGFDSRQADQKFFDGKWRPSSFDDPEVVVREALDDIFPMIERDLVARFGFPRRVKIDERDFTDTDLAL